MIPQPTNNIFLGGDPLLNTSSLDAQISALKDLAQRYEAARQRTNRSGDRKLSLFLYPCR